jgi:hypothetical protein
MGSVETAIGNRAIFLNRAELRLPLVITILFLASRLVAWVLGVRFDYVINDLWFMDVAHLQNHLWESLFYLHSQPPLFNLFLGAVLKLSSDMAPVIFHACFVVLGLVMTLSIYGTLRLITVPAVASAVAALIYGLSPTAILYENLLNHTYVMAAIFALAALAFARFATRPSWGNIVLLALTLAMLSLLRSAYHLVWLLMIAVFVIVVRPHEWRKVMIAFAIPILLVFGLMAKNQILFSTFSLSSWMGLNLSRVAVPSTQPREFREELLRQGLITPITLDRTWQPDLHRDFPKLAQGFLDHRPTGIAILDECLKSTQNPDDPPHLRRNYHCLDNLLAGKALMHDALVILRHRPQDYLRGVSWAVQYYFDSPINYFRIAEANKAALDPGTSIFEFLVYGMMPEAVAARLPVQPRLAEKLPHTGLWIVVLIPAVGVLTLWRGGRLLIMRVRGDAAPIDVANAAFLFLGVNILFFSAVFNLFEVGENNRFRVDIEPLIYCAGLFLAFQAVRTFQTRYQSIPLQADTG